MSTQTVSSTGLAGLPRVNLLPPEIAEAQRFRQLQLLMGGAVVLAVVAVGGLYVHAKSGVTSAQSSLTSAEAGQQATQQKLNSLASVKSTYAEVASKQAQLASAMGQEIRWSTTLNDLSLRVPSNVWFTAITANETSVGSSTTAAAPTTTATTSPATVGTMDFTGVAMTRDGVANWLDAMSREKGFVDPSFSSSSETLIGARKVDGFGTSVGLDSSILSNRYTTKAN